MLDTVAEPVFADLVKLAADICQTPISLISLVDHDRQWFKAKTGFPATETPRQVLFCTHTILNDEPFVVPDATQDPRFAENPLVLGEPSIRLYAGAPLTTPEGLRIGTLCVIDRTPWTLSAFQINALAVFAKQVITQLKLRAKVSQQSDLYYHLQLSEARYRALSDASPLGIFGTNPNGDCHYVNPKYETLSGLTLEECRGRGWLNAIHPDDRERAGEEWYRATKEHREYESVHRFLRPDGSSCWSHVRAGTIRKGEELVGYVGTVEDITEKKKAAELLIEKSEQLELALRGGDLGLWDWNTQTGEVYCSDRWCAMLGYTRDEVEPNVSS